MELPKGGNKYVGLYDSPNYDDLVDRDANRLHKKPILPKENNLPGFGKVITHGEIGATNIPNAPYNPNDQYITLLPNMLNGKPQPTTKITFGNWTNNTKLPSVLDLKTFGNKDVVSIMDKKEPIVDNTTSSSRSIVPTKRVSNVTEIPSIKFEGFMPKKLNDRVKRLDFTDYTTEDHRIATAKIQQNIASNKPLSIEEKIYYHSNNNNEFDPSLIQDIREREMLKQEAIRRGINIKPDNSYHTYSSNSKKKEKVVSPRFFQVGGKKVVMLDKEYVEANVNNNEKIKLTNVVPINKANIKDGISGKEYVLDNTVYSLSNNDISTNNNNNIVPTIDMSKDVIKSTIYPTEQEAAKPANKLSKNDIPKPVKISDNSLISFQKSMGIDNPTINITPQVINTYNDLILSSINTNSSDKNKLESDINKFIMHTPSEIKNKSWIITAKSLGYPITNKEEFGTNFAKDYLRGKTINPVYKEILIRFPFLKEYINKEKTD